MRQEDDGLIFAGVVYARNRRIAGSTFRDIGNTTSLQIKSSTDKKERVSKRKGSYGQALDSISQKKPAEVSFKLDTFDRDNLAMVLVGEAVVLEASAQKVTDENVTITKKGEWYQLSRDNIDPTTIKVKNATSQAVAETDVEYNANLGLIAIKPSCANVQDGEIVKVTFSTRNGGGFRIDADTVGDFDLEIMIDAENRVSGKNGKLHIPSAVVSSESDLDWLKDDFNEAGFKGNAVLVAGHKSAYSFSEFN